MPKSVDTAALLIAMLGAVLALTLLPGPFAFLASIGGLVLLLTLLAFDREGYRSAFESVAFAGAAAFCLMVAAAAPLNLVAANQGRAASVPGEWLPLFWVGMTVILWPIDRARMSGRVQAPPAAFSFQPVAAAAQGAHLAHTLPLADYAPPAQAPAPGIPFVHPPPPPPQQMPYAPPPSVPPPAPEPAAAPLAPPVNALPVPSGKEATIYVTLMGEGINLLRPVRAEMLGRDYYRIVEEMPSNEIWEYGPGQIVKCKKKNLSSGKAMVAVEEAPRAR